MEVALLGELEVRDGRGAAVEVRGGKVRALLAVLALGASRPVSGEQLADALWGEDLPTGTRNALQALVSKLRKALGDPNVVSTRANGYALELPPEAIDVHRFERLRSAGRLAAEAGDHAGAVELLTEAEALWRGDVLAEFADEHFAVAASARLTELRLSGLEDRIDAELALGRHHAVVAVLEDLVARHPLRERFWAQLMLARYRDGRQADALRAFQDARRVLAEELGLDPGPELRRLEAAVLAHDPTLEVVPSPAAPAAPTAAARRQLPAAVSVLIGRDADRDAVVELVTDHRLVTLTGPGGVGKTSLALAAARVVADRMASGAALVELSPIGDGRDVLPAIAAALDAPDPDRLASLVGERELLLVLDNCEHVIDDAAAASEDLLRRCPNLRVLATSRERLRAGGERVWLVPPLAPDAAVELFRERARDAGVGLAVGDGDDEIAEVCARLDGLPLAIELAAARTRAFSMAQVAAGLDDRFRLLTGGARTAARRQQTLRAVVAWSYDLLFDEQRRVFERLGVLPGGCALATAAAVCADDEIPADDIEDIVGALVDKSLLVVQRRGGEVRYGMLQTLAEYALERLAERGDADRVRARAARHHAALCGRSLEAFSGTDQQAWLAAVAAEHENLRASLDWACETGDAELAVSIAGGAAWAQWLGGRLFEGRQWLEDAFAVADGAVLSPATRAVGLFGRGYLRFVTGDRAGVDGELDEAATIFEEIGDLRGLAITLGFHAETAAARGDTAGTRALRERCLDVNQRLPGDQFALASATYCRAVIARTLADPAGAERHFRAAADEFGAGGNAVMRAICLDVVARFDEHRGDFERAAEELREAVELNDALGLHGFASVLLGRLASALIGSGKPDHARLVVDRTVDLAGRMLNGQAMAMGLAGAARLALFTGDLDEAARSAYEALDVCEALTGNRRWSRVNPWYDGANAAAVALLVLGWVAVRRGEAADAMAHQRRGLVQARRSGEPRAVAAALEGVAGAAAAGGRRVSAERLLRHAAAFRAAHGCRPAVDEQERRDTIR